jgi:hypothetical protein
MKQHTYRKSKSIVLLQETVMAKDATSNTTSGSAISEQTSTAQSATAAPVATVETVKTPSAVALTNQQRAAAFREQFAAPLAEIGNNMSAKIRYLHDQGLSMGDISRVLVVQFQFVRNVKTNYESKLAKEALAAAAKAATPPVTVTTPTPPIVEGPSA